MTRALFLEGISPVATEMLSAHGVEVESLTGALSEADLIAKVRNIQLLGIRSKTRVTRAVLDAAPELLSVGCFCIGTNQVDLDTANAHGVPVFNAPFSNTRSVAELVLAEIIALSRGLCDSVRDMHAGQWKKTAAGAREVRGRTLGIVGYGHIGSQIGLIAEAFGMRVVYFDIAQKLPLANNQPLESLEEVLKVADFVTLHVPETPQTRDMMGAAQIAAMQKGAYLINASRGNVVDLGALKAALQNKHLAGAALDVFPEEPEKNGAYETSLRGVPNVILTPHIGGSTEEAQLAIGREVSRRFLGYMTAGTTVGAVNFPQVELPKIAGTTRVMNIHKNVPGVVSEISRVLARHGGNIRGQMLSTDANVGYLVMDVDGLGAAATGAAAEIAKAESSLRTRID